MKKMFIFNVCNHIDLITNSSSELFVLDGDTKETVDEMIREIYPDYTSEYEEVVSLREASDEQIDTYLNWVEEPWHYDYRHNLTKEERKKIDIDKHIAKAKRYNMDPNQFYVNWEEELKSEWFYPKITSEGLRRVASVLDPNGKIFLLFSISDNPNWDYQEKLECIASRYHLG